ncbi:MAG: ABC transporter ATP-binding protein [bacterium]
MPAIQLKNISNFICRNISLQIANGELMVLLGPTGAGKTTLLNIVSGLIDHEGSILFDGVSIDEIPVNRRNVGYLLQDLALFPHLDVASNITYGLKMQKRRVNEIKARLDEMLDLMNIPDLAWRYPKDLSGGEKQRVALARAMAIKPRLLLLDEPLSNLDAKLRIEMRSEIRSIQQELKITAIYVTHDQNEALSLGDRISVLNEGKIEQVGAPDELFYHPETEFVARFVGFKNILKVSIIEIKQHEAVVYINNECIDKPFKIRVKRYPIFKKGKEISICIHPERIILKRVNGLIDSNLNRMMGKIVDRRNNGKNIRATVDIGGSEIHAAVPKALFDFKIHEDVWACFAPDAAHPLCGRRSD